MHHHHNHQTTSRRCCWWWQAALLLFIITTLSIDEFSHHQSTSHAETHRLMRELTLHRQQGRGTLLSLLLLSLTAGGTMYIYYVIVILDCPQIERKKSLVKKNMNAVKPRDEQSKGLLAEHYWQGRKLFILCIKRIPQCSHIGSTV